MRQAHHRIKVVLFFPLQNFVSLLAQSHRTKHSLVALEFAQIQKLQKINFEPARKSTTTVSLNEVRSANANLKTRHESLTAVFAGATRGLGLATLKAFAKDIPKPTAIVVGRSKKQFDVELQNLRTINPNGTYTFLEAEVSLIKSIDAVCEEIKKQVSSIDLLFVSQGFLNFAGRQNNDEGLDTATSLRYYGRVRFTQNLVSTMAPNARVVSILAGGMEGKIFEEDLDLERNYSLLNSMGHFTTMVTLSNDKLAEQNPGKGFLHVYPGFVNTGVLARSGGSSVLGYLFWMVEAIVGWFILQPEEVGERMLYYATSEQYAKGSWSLDWDGTPKNAKALVEYREKGMMEKVEHHNQRIFEKITSA